MDRVSQNSTWTRGSSRFKASFNETEAPEKASANPGTVFRKKGRLEAVWVIKQPSTSIDDTDTLLDKRSIPLFEQGNHKTSSLLCSRGVPGTFRHQVVTSEHQSKKTCDKSHHNHFQTRNGKQPAFFKLNNVNDLQLAQSLTRKYFKKSSCDVATLLKYLRLKVSEMSPKICTQYFQTVAKLVGDTGDAKEKTFKEDAEHRLLVKDLADHFVAYFPKARCRVSGFQAIISANLCPKDIALTAWSCGRLDFFHAELMHVLAWMILGCLNYIKTGCNSSKLEGRQTLLTVNSIDIANLLWACSRLQFRHNELLSSLVKEAVCSLHQFDAHSIASTFVALGALDLRNTELTPTSPEQKSKYTKQHEDNFYISLDHYANGSKPLGCDFDHYLNTRSNLVVTNGTPYPRTSCIKKILVQKLQDFDTRRLCNFLWSCAKLSWRSKEILNTVLCLLTPKVHEMQPQHVANSMWSCGQLRLEANGSEFISSITCYLLSPIFSVKRQNNMTAFPQLQVHQQDAQGISNIFWALGKMNVVHQELLEALSEYSIRLRQTFLPQHLANIIWACGKLGFKNEPLLKALTHIAAKKLSFLTPQNIANVYWGLGKLRFNIESCLLFPSSAVPSDKSRILSTLLTKIQCFEAQSVSNMMLASAYLQWSHPELTKALVKRMELLCLAKQQRHLTTQESRTTEFRRNWGLPYTASAAVHPATSSCSSTTAASVEDESDVDIDTHKPVDRSHITCTKLSPKASQLTSTVLLRCRQNDTTLLPLETAQLEQSLRCEGMSNCSDESYAIGNEIERHKNVHCCYKVFNYEKEFNLTTSLTTSVKENLESCAFAQEASSSTNPPHEPFLDFKQSNSLENNTATCSPCLAQVKNNKTSQHERDHVLDFQHLSNMCWVIGTIQRDQNVSLSDRELLPHHVFRLFSIFAHLLIVQHCQGTTLLQRRETPSNTRSVLTLPLSVRSSSSFSHVPLQHLSLMLWGFASVRLRNDRVFDILTDEVLRRLCSVASLTQYTTAAASYYNDLSAQMFYVRNFMEAAQDIVPSLCQTIWALGRVFFRRCDIISMTVKLLLEDYQRLNQKPFEVTARHLNKQGEFNNSGTMCCSPTLRHKMRCEQSWFWKVATLHNASNILWGLAVILHGKHDESDQLTYVRSGVLVPHQMFSDIEESSDSITFPDEDMKKVKFGFCQLCLITARLFFTSDSETDVNSNAVTFDPRDMTQIFHAMLASRNILRHRLTWDKDHHNDTMLYINEVSQHLKWLKSKMHLKGGRISEIHVQVKEALIRLFPTIRYKPNSNCFHAHPSYNFVTTTATNALHENIISESMDMEEEFINDDLISCDIALKRDNGAHLIVVEIDGPWHYIRVIGQHALQDLSPLSPEKLHHGYQKYRNPKTFSSKISLERTSSLRERTGFFVWLDGRTRLKRQLLRESGALVVNLPFYELAFLTHQQLEEYLFQRLEKYLHDEKITMD